MGFDLGRVEVLEAGLFGQPSRKTASFSRTTLPIISLFAAAWVMMSLGLRQVLTRDHQESVQ